MIYLDTDDIFGLDMKGFRTPYKIYVKPKSNVDILEKYSN